MIILSVNHKLFIHREIETGSQQEKELTEGRSRYVILKEFLLLTIFQASTADVLLLIEDISSILMC